MAPTSRFRADDGAVLESLYEAALQPELMPSALHAFARACNGSVGVILSLADHQGRVIVSPDGKDGAEAYASGWWAHDFVTARGNERNVYGIVTDLELSTAEERASHPFYQEFGRQFDCFWICAHVVRQPGRGPVAISVRRPEEFGPFLAPEIERLGTLGKHAARAFEIANKLADASSHSAALCECLTNLGYGVIGIGNSGRVLFANTVVERLGGDGLWIANGAVLAGGSPNQRALEVLISQTLSLADGSTRAPPQPVVIHRPSGRLPAVVYGVPIADRHADLLTILGGRPQALLVVVEPDSAHHLDERLLQEMFGLSPGEARLAVAIGTGATTKDAAKQFGVTEGTLRVVLKHVFQKVGVSRQAELVLLLAPLLRRA